MKKRIIVDSCCDITDSMKEEMAVATVPLTMMLGKTEFIDNEALVMPDFMQTMKTCKGKVSSASPSPYLFQKAIENTESEYVITLSSNLSSSYGNAIIGNRQAMEESGRSVHIFDSKSASAGETLVAIKLYELIKEGLPKARIIQTVHSFIDNMKTYFVLEKYDNLQKNGRLGKIAVSLINILNIKLIMGDDGNGEIKLAEKCMGAKRMLQQLLSLIEKSGKGTKNENLVISHCNNRSFAEQLKARITEKFNFRKIYIVPTSGVSSLYADDKGIILAF